MVRARLPVEIQPVDVRPSGQDRPRAERERLPGGE
ncbi:hypothetical protein M2271_000127 [Streptomyces sp. LBL]|nr:hypothetical protein [Streptomyces sp. LBL]